MHTCTCQHRAHTHISETHKSRNHDKTCINQLTIRGITLRAQSTITKPITQKLFTKELNDNSNNKRKRINHTNLKVDDKHNAHFTELKDDIIDINKR